MEKYKKVDIDEIIDGDDNIIGSKNDPESGPDLETRASKTTDYNAKVHGQNFKNDFLGRFGFYFYEDDSGGMSPVMESIVSIVGEEHVNAVMEAIKPHMEKTLDEIHFNLNEGTVDEDKITASKEDKSLTKKQSPKEFANKKIEDVAELLNKLPSSDIRKLKGLLEDTGENVAIPSDLKKKMKGVSLNKDKEGKYFVHTHRGRSESYNTPEDIPNKEIKWVESTG